STTYPGTTRQVVLPILEGSGLRTGEDFFLAYSPEREDPGNRDYSTRVIPKVVGAIDAPSREASCALYDRVISRVVPVSSTEVAAGIKDAMPAYVARRLAEALSDWGKPLKGSRVALLGVAYKRDVGDCRDAPSLKLMDLLWQAGASVSYHDPYVPSLAATRRH